MKPLIKISLIFLALVSFLFLSKAFFLDIYQDFNYYYYASQAAFQQINPYLPGGPYTGYLYPPIVLILLSPFQLLPLMVASKVWIGLSLLGVIFSLIILFKIHKLSLLSPLSLIIFACVFSFFPLKFTLGMGQINVFILVFLVLALYFYIKEKDALSGFFFGLTITIKYFPLLIIFYLIFRRKWKILRYLLLSVISLFILGYLLIDQNINNYFLFNTLPSLLQSTGGYYYNQALSGFVSRTLDGPSAEFVIRIVLSLLILFTTFFVMYKKKKTNKAIILFEMGILITVNLLLSSFTWQHHFTWLLIPLVFTAMVINKKSEYAMLFIIFLLLTYNIRPPVTAPMFLQSHAFFGALLLWGFELYLLHKANFQTIKINGK